MSNTSSTITSSESDELLKNAAADTPFYFCDRHPETEAIYAAKYIKTLTDGLLTFFCCNACADELQKNCPAWVELVKIKKEKA